MGLDVLIIILSGSFLKIIGCWPQEAKDLGIKDRLGIKSFNSSLFCAQIETCF